MKLCAVRICNLLHFVRSWLIIFRHSLSFTFHPIDVVVAELEVGVEPAFFVLRRVLLSPKAALYFDTSAELAWAVYSKCPLTYIICCHNHALCESGFVIDQKMYSND